jgi:hypothetical protein
MSRVTLASVIEPQQGIRALVLTALESDGDALQKAHLILRYSHDSAKAFLVAFDKMRRDRGARRGATTDEEQDLLRAMLVMAAAGLDSMLKQIIRDTLEILIQSDDDVREGLEKFVSRQIRGDAKDEGLLTGHRFLARVLIAESQQDQVIEEYIRHLTGISLQSVTEVKRTVNALGITPSVVQVPDQALRLIIDARNRIIHEFDINFAALRRNRQSRTRDVMIGATNALLKVAECILEAVDGKLASAPAAT